MEESQWASLGSASYTEAKRLKAALEDRGVELRLVSDPESCGTGSCSPKLEILIRPADLPRFQAFVAEERARELGDLNHDAALVDQVFDPEQESATCPACGTEFSTRLTECPDCGLCFSVG